MTNKISQPLIYPTFNWWVGIVEDRIDPLNLGRLRVRVFGYHTFDKELIKTDELPWYYVMQPITSAAMNGIGTTPTGIVEGTHVIGFFKDGDNLQEGVVMGTVGGIEPSTPPDGDIPWQKTTFNYKNTEYPKWKDEPDTNRLAPNGKTVHPVLAIKDAARDLDITPANFRDGKQPQHTTKSTQEATCSTVWNERKHEYAGKYPFNHVRETESGHIEEFDDTENNERYHIYHRANTYKQIYPDGSTVEHITKDNYRLVLDNERIHIATDKVQNVDKNYKLKVNADNNTGANFEIEIGDGGDINIAVNKGNINIYMKEGDVNTHLVKGNVNNYVDTGSIDTRIKTGDSNLYVETGDIDIDVNEGNIEATIQVGDIDIDVETGDINTRIGTGDMNTQLDAGNINTKVEGNWNVDISGTINITSGGNTNIDGANIHLNQPTNSSGFLSTALTTPLEPPEKDTVAETLETCDVNSGEINP